MPRRYNCRLVIPEQQDGDEIVHLVACRKVVPLPNWNRGDGGHVHFRLWIVNFSDGENISEGFIASMHEVLYWQFLYGELIASGHGFESSGVIELRHILDKNESDGPSLHESAMSSVDKFFLCSEKLFCRLKGNDPGINKTSMETFISTANIGGDMHAILESLRHLRDFYSDEQTDPQYLRLVAFQAFLGTCGYISLDAIVTLLFPRVAGRILDSVASNSGRDNAVRMSSYVGSRVAKKNKDAVFVSGTVVDHHRSQMAFLVLYDDGSRECCSNYARMLYLFATRLKVEMADTEDFLDDVDARLVTFRVAVKPESGAGSALEFGHVIRINDESGCYTLYFEGSNRRLEEVEFFDAATAAHAAAKNVETDLVRDSIFTRWNRPVGGLIDQHWAVSSSRPSSLVSLNENSESDSEDEERMLKSQLFEIWDEREWRAGRRQRAAALLASHGNWAWPEWDDFLPDLSDRPDVVNAVSRHCKFVDTILCGCGSWKDVVDQSKVIAEKLCDSFDTSKAGLMLKKIVTAMSSPKCTAVYQRFSPGTFEGGEAPNTGKGQARSISDYLAGRDDFGPIKSDTRVTDHKASRRSPGNAGLCKIILLMLKGRIDAVVVKGMIRITGSPFIAAYFSAIAETKNVRIVSVSKAEANLSLWEVAMKEHRRYQLVSMANRAYKKLSSSVDPLAEDGDVTDYDWNSAGAVTDDE